MKITWMAGILAAAAVQLMAQDAARAEPVVYLDQEAYLNALTSLEYDAIHEGFEDDTAWGSVRSTIAGGTFTAPGITNLGVTWTANNLSSEITTGQGPAHCGTWGFYSRPHGSYENPDPGTDCFVPGDCGDGVRGAAVNGEFYAIGGWWDTNTPFAKLGLFLGNYPDNPVDFGETCVPPGSEDCFDNAIIGTSQEFFGVIEPAGFTKFEFRELEGKLEPGGGDVKFIFSDDFYFVLSHPEMIYQHGFERTAAPCIPED
jgi:hypothetical protein